MCTDERDEANGQDVTAHQLLAAPREDAEHLLVAPADGNQQPAAFGELLRRDILPVRFVPLIGAHGWHS